MCARRLLVCVCHFPCLPLRGRSRPNVRRRECKGQIFLCVTTLPSGSFLACHLPLHRGGEHNVTHSKRAPRVRTTCARRLLVCVCHFPCLPLRGRSRPNVRRRECKGQIFLCVTTLPSGSFLACHLPLHRGGENKMTHSKRAPRVRTTCARRSSSRKNRNTIFAGSLNKTRKRKSPMSFLIGPFLAIGLSINQTVASNFN